METRKTKKAEVSFCKACLWEVTGRWRGTEGACGHGIHPRQGRAGWGEEGREVWRLLVGNSTRHLHYKYKQLRLSGKTALKCKIDVPDDTCINHIFMFRHTAIWPNHSKQLLVSCSMLCIRADYSLLYRLWNMSVAHVCFSLNNITHEYWME